MIGTAPFMGGETTPSRAIVQSAGLAYRLAGQLLRDEFHRSGDVRLLRRVPSGGQAGEVPASSATSVDTSLAPDLKPVSRSHAVDGCYLFDKYRFPARVITTYSVVVDYNTISD